MRRLITASYFAFHKIVKIFDVAGRI